jgi:hypothetical protein
MSLSKAAVGASLIVLLASSSVRAIVVVSNLSEPNQVDFGADGTVNAAAGSFTTSAAGAYKLNSVNVDMNFNADTGVTTGLRLRADNGGMPGALIENLGSQTGGPGQQILTYSSLGSILSPNTTYWVTLGETGSGNAQQWLGTFSTAETSPISWTIGNQTFNSPDHGATWHQLNSGFDFSAPLFSLNATPVPEPSSVGLGIIGLVGLLGLRGVRRRFGVSAYPR